MGTSSVRPSDNSTAKVSALKVTLLGEILIPFLLNQPDILGDDLFQLPQRTGVKAVTTGETNRRHCPKFRLATLSTHVYVHRLPSASLVQNRNAL